MLIMICSFITVVFLRIIAHPSVLNIHVKTCSPNCGLSHSQPLKCAFLVSVKYICLSMQPSYNQLKA